MGRKKCRRYDIMAHFARVDTNNVVIEVIVIDNNSLKNLEFPKSEEPGRTFIRSIGKPGKWYQCSYNKSFRKNYPGKGFVYNPKLDAFIPPQPYPSWTLNRTTCQWDPPISYPPGKELYDWDENTKTWAYT